MENKECFSILENVFPMGERGFREVPPECFECSDKVACLTEALKTKEGLEMRSEHLDRVSKGGMIGWLKRWSQKKELSRLMDEQKNRKK